MSARIIASRPIPVPTSLAECCPSPGRVVCARVLRPCPRPRFCFRTAPAEPSAGFPAVGKSSAPVPGPGLSTAPRVGAILRRHASPSSVSRPVRRSCIASCRSPDRLTRFHGAHAYSGILLRRPHMMDRRRLNRFPIPGPLPAAVSVPPQDAPAQSAPPLALVTIPSHFVPSPPAGCPSSVPGLSPPGKTKARANDPTHWVDHQLWSLSTLALCDIHDIPAFALSAVQPQPDGFHVRRRFLEFIPDQTPDTSGTAHIRLSLGIFYQFCSTLQGLFLLFSTMDELLRLVSRQKLLGGGRFRCLGCV